MGKSCGSCIHTNVPKKPREHAAHYETAKTERWCFKHNCHVTRETTCEDHEGINRGAKTAFTRTKNYNLRQKEVLKVIELMNGREVVMRDKTFFIEDGWLKYQYHRSSGSYTYSISSRQSNTDRYLKELKEHLK